MGKGAKKAGHQEASDFHEESAKADKLQYRLSFLAATGCTALVGAGTALAGQGHPALGAAYIAGGGVMAGIFGAEGLEEVQMYAEEKQRAAVEQERADNINV